MVKNLPANASDMGSISDPGRFHTPQSNYAHSTTPEAPRASEPVLGDKSSRCLRSVHYNQEELRCHSEGKPTSSHGDPVRQK